MLSRRGFFGIAAGAAAVAAGGVSASPAEAVFTGGVSASPAEAVFTPMPPLLSEERAALAAIRWENLRYYYGVKGHRWGGLSQIAANKPVVHSPAVRAAIADQERRKKMPQKKFEDLLSAPIGKGRLE